MKKLTKRDILDAAATVFIEQGFEGATFAKVAARLGGVIGSIQHAYRRKPELAAAVYDDLVDELIAGCEAALSGQGRDPETAIRALLRACLIWGKKVRGRRHLLVLLEANVSIRRMSKFGVLQKRMEQVLAAWAEPLIKVNLVVPMSPGQLYAVLLAPVLSTVDSEEFDDAKRLFEWLNKLAEFALNGITRQAMPTPPTSAGLAEVSSKSTELKPQGADQGKLF